MVRHKVFLSQEGLVENVYHGDVGYGDLQEVFKQTYALGFKLQDEKKPVNLLVDLREIGRVSLLGVGSLATLGIKSFPFNRIAVFGARREIELMAKLVVGMAGKRKTLKMFKERVEAVGWLRESGGA